MAKTSITIWTITDQRPGHHKQAEALVEGLASFVPCQNFMIPVSGRLWRRLSTSRKAAATLVREQGAPDLLLGVGHATHLPLLALQRRFGGKTVLLMKPSLPTRLFNYVLIPLHDEPKPGRRVWPTDGALCSSCPPAEKSSTGLILIGGPDSRFHWDSAALQAQIKTICDATPAIQWIASNSRRTPNGFLKNLPLLQNLSTVEHTQKPSDWLATTLPTAASTWITPDSVSMVYEALSVGSPVGVLQLAQRSPNKLSRNLERLSELGDITFFNNWVTTDPLPMAGRIYAENSRCAARLLQSEQWFGLPEPDPSLEP